MRRAIALMLVLLLMVVSLAVFTPAGAEEKGRATIPGGPVYIMRTNVSYSTIQGAIDAAQTDDIIRIFDGTYNENIEVNKLVHLQGNSSDTTIINGNKQQTHVVDISSSDASIENVAITGSQIADWSSNSGIYITGDKAMVSKCRVYSNQNGIAINADNVTVIQCEGEDNIKNGIWIEKGSNALICDCVLVENSESGIHIVENWASESDIARNVMISNNLVMNSKIGIKISNPYGGVLRDNVVVNCSIWAFNIDYYSDSGTPPKFTVYKNDFINNGGENRTNISQAFTYGDHNLDNGEIGNYWSDWTTPDNDSDGIVDRPYVTHQAGVKDMYPSVEPFQWIEGGGGGDVEDGSITIQRTGDTFDNILDAKNASQSGDTILLGKGTFRCSYLSIEHSLTIVGEGPNETIVKGSNIFYLDADDCHIGGITFQSNDDFTSTGVTVFGDEARISDCSFVNCIPAIESRDANDLLISSCEIIKNDPSFDVDLSVIIDGGDEIDIYGLKITGLEMSGIWINECSDVWITDLHSEIARWSGVAFNDCSKVRLLNSRIENSIDGVAIAEETNDVMIRSTQFRNNHRSIAMVGGADLRVRGCNFQGASFAGLSIWPDSMNVTVYDCVFNGNKYGIHCETNVEDVIVYNNEFYNSTGSHALSNSTGLMFDDGMRGNYWDDHAGYDSNSDGIYDNPHQISGYGNCTDRYPLTKGSVPDPSSDPPTNLYMVFPSTIYADTETTFQGYADDPEGGDVSFEWYLDGVLISYGPMISLNLTEGNHTLRLVAIDENGDWSEREMDIVVHPKGSQIDGPGPETELFGLSLTTWIVIIVIIVIAIILALAVVVVANRKRIFNAEGEPEEPEVVEELDDYDEEDIVDFSADPDEIEEEEEMEEETFELSEEKIEFLKPEQDRLAEVEDEAYDYILADKDIPDVKVLDKLQKQYEAGKLSEDTYNRIKSTIGASSKVEDEDDFVD